MLGLESLYLSRKYHGSVVKRITIWLDCRDEILEDSIRKIEERLKSIGLWFKVVCVDELAESLRGKSELEK